VHNSKKKELMSKNKNGHDLLFDEVGKKIWHFQTNLIRNLENDFYQISGLLEVEKSNFSKKILLLPYFQNSCQAPDCNEGKFCLKA